MAFDAARLKALTAAHGRVVRVVVAEVRGSAPREAGAAIFAAIRDIWPLATLKVADRGLREGILVDLMRADGHAIDPCDARRHTVSHIPAST